MIIPINGGILTGENDFACTPDLIEVLKDNPIDDQLSAFSATEKLFDETIRTLSATTVSSQLVKSTSTAVILKNVFNSTKLRSQII